MSEQYGGTQLLTGDREIRVALGTRLTAQAEAQLRLRRSDYHELHLISCAFYGGVLTLLGRVSNFYLKQVAQTLVLGIDGVARVCNRLEVVSPLRSV
jgi:osmotically-inducible protein OsmY